VTPRTTIPAGEAAARPARDGVARAASARRQGTGQGAEVAADRAARALHQALYFARRALEPGPPARAPSAYLSLDAGVPTLSPAAPPWIAAGAFGTAAHAARRSRDAGTCGAPYKYGERPAICARPASVTGALSCASTMRDGGGEPYSSPPQYEPRGPARALCRCREGAEE
jgi:hypothetical protein